MSYLVSFLTAASASASQPPTMANTTDSSSGSFQGPSHPQAGLGAAGAYPFAMLDVLIPGFSVFSSALHTYTNIDLNMYIPFIMFVSWFMWSGSYMSGFVWSWVEEYLMCSVRIRTDDEIFNMIMAWVAKQDFSQESRNFMANTNTNSRSWSVWYLMQGDDDEDDDDNDNDRGRYGRSAESKKKTELKYTPSYGSHRFWYKGKLLFFNRMENRDTAGGSLLASEKEEITISCLWWSPLVLKELLMEVREQYIHKDESKTVIYRGTFSVNDGTNWTRCMARASRPFSTVILNEDVKQQLITDVTDYLKPATRKWYSNRGIPYRRGYLLYGPPGTGKSSLSLALAGFFGLRIYILSLSSPSATEESVSQLFSSLPRKCVVLLEDIDTAGLTHTRDVGAPESPETPENEDDASRKGKGSPGRRSKEPSTPSQPSGRLSLSGLLNILDGVASQEGRVLIMTTNHLEKLDKALIRPGRVDLTVEFGYANEDMVASIFRAIYAPYEGEDVPPAISRDVAVSEDDVDEKEGQQNDNRDYLSAKKAAADRAATLATVEDLAKQFAAKIPQHEFSPAEIQGLLLKYKRDPLAAIEGVDLWIGDTRKEKAEKKIREAEEKRKQEEEEAKKKQEEEQEKQGKKDEEKKEDEKKDMTDTKSTETTTEGKKDEKDEAKAKKTASDSGYETP